MPAGSSQHYLIAVLVSGLLPAGCDEQPQRSDLIPAEDYCEAVAGPFCDFYLRCGRMAVGSQEECRAVLLETCNMRYEPRWLDLVEAGLIELSAPGIAACASHLQSVACEDQIFELTGPCAEIWTGKQPAGAACSLDLESFVCVPGTACAIDTSFCGTCKPVATIGEPCGADTTCGAEAVCEAGSCKARSGIGGSCASMLECQLGARCVSSRCEAPNFPAEGDPCESGRCRTYMTTCIAGSCQRNALLGEACGADSVCDGGLCVAEGAAPVCVEPHPDLHACDSASQCASGRCVDSVCAPLPGQCFSQ